MNACTIIARNYAAHARVLARSFKATHPEGNFAVLVVDEPDGHLDPANEPFELIRLDEIGLPDAAKMAAVYDVVELSTGVKPWLLRHLLDRDGDTITYLDPDIRVEDSLAEIERRAREHGAVLTPHLTKPLPRDGRKPGEEDIMIAGSYNLGFISLGAEGGISGPLLEWWSERLENECLVDPGNGLFVDQRWIDLAPGLWSGISILRDPGYNVAYWNLPRRRLEIDGDGYRVDGEPLHFFHFSGYDPRRPDQLSKHQNRIDLRSDPALARICDEYGEELRENGYEEARTWSYGWNQAANGLQLDRIARGLYREGVDSGRLEDSIFSPAGAATFTEYLTATVHGTETHPVNRYASALWEARQDLRDVFPDIEGASAAAYLEWMRNFADEAGISAELLVSEPGANGGAPEAAGNPGPGEPVELRTGVNVVGYISSERGVGEAARQVLTALESRGIPAAPLDTPADPAEIEKVLRGVSDADHPYDYNLICVNADMLPAVAAGLGPRFFEGRRTAGLWFWEVSQFPPQWHDSFKHLDEVWVASEFIAESLRPVSPVPVRTMRVPVTPATPEEMTRAELGMPEGFCFLFIFDYRSVFRRKNPLGLVEAFRRAFEPGEGPSLVIKSIFGEDFQRHREQLAEAVADRPEIHLIEDNIPAAAKNAMVTSCDCYVSLHRSEGLGLTMAEAMYFGKPVIATSYSGNLDFMTQANSFLVPSKAAKIGDDADPYPPDGIWVDPDLDHAAALMRAVFSDKKAREDRARRGAADIRLTHSPEAAAAWIEARIDEGRTDELLHELHGPPTAAPGPSPRGELDHLLGFGGLPPLNAESQVKGSAKRAYNRLLRPYASYQHQINANNIRALDELRQQILELRGLLAHTVELDADAFGRLAGAEEGLERLNSEDAHIEARLQPVEDLVDAAAAQPYMADERLAERRHPLLGGTLGFRTEGEGAHEGYRSFEDLFRGSEETIRERQRVYLDLVAEHQPVFDAGCGRGEFLDLLAEREIEFQGVDLDPDMVERCHQKGYESVVLGDALEVLERAEPGSLGTIFSAQVIEHLPYEQLLRLLELGLSRLKPGGLFIAETVNPHSARALKAFWVDPTHQHPLFPEVMLSLCETAGYVSGDVFAPVGSGDWERDRTQVGEYAVVAVAPGEAEAEADAAEPDAAAD